MRDMDKKPFRNNKSKNTKGKRKGFKNVGFVALVILLSLIVFAAYGQPSTLKEIPESTAISQANRGDYSKVIKSGNELKITKRGDAQPSLKTYTDPKASLKESGFNTSKFEVSNKPMHRVGLSGVL